MEPHGALWCHHFTQGINLVGVATLLLAVAGAGSMDQERPTRVVSSRYNIRARPSRNEFKDPFASSALSETTGLCSNVTPLVGHPLLLKMR